MGSWATRWRGLWSGRVKPEDLQVPRADAVLAQDMESAAAEYAASMSGLDFSVESVTLVSRRVRTATADELPGIAAYVGEVLVRHGGGCWGRTGKYGELAGVAIGVGISEPSGWISIMRADDRYPDEFLAEAVGEVIAAGGDPELIVAEGTMRIEPVSQWEATRHQLAKWRRDWRGRGRAGAGQ